MTATNDLIEQIVANVLAELQPPPPVRAPVASSSPLPTPPKVITSIVEIESPVVTADLLAARVQSGQAVRISPRSILTPSARDWLAQRKITWTRNSGAKSSPSHASARWQLVIASVTPAVATLRNSLAGWKTDLLGTPQEAAEAANRAISTGEADGVLGLCRAAEVVACIANRNPKVRAAVLHTIGELGELATHLNPNVLVINPQGKSFIELRNLTRAVGALSTPGNSSPWLAGSK